MVDTQMTAAVVTLAACITESRCSPAAAVTADSDVIMLPVAAHAGRSDVIETADDSSADLDRYITTTTRHSVTYRQTDWRVDAAVENKAIVDGRLRPRRVTLSPSKIRVESVQ